MQVEWTLVTYIVNRSFASSFITMINIEENSIWWTGMFTSNCGEWLIILSAGLRSGQIELMDKRRDALV